MSASNGISAEEQDEIRAIFLNLFLKASEVYSWLRLYSQHDFDESLAPVYDENGFCWRAVNPYHTKEEVRSALKESTSEAYSDFMIFQWMERGPGGFKEINGRLYARMIDDSEVKRSPYIADCVFDTFRVESVEKEKIVVLCDAPRGSRVYEFIMIWENERWVLTAWAGMRSNARTSSSTS